MYTKEIIPTYMYALSFFFFSLFFKERRRGRRGKKKVEIIKVPDF